MCTVLVTFYTKWFLVGHWINQPYRISMPMLHQWLVSLCLINTRKIGIDNISVGKCRTIYVMIELFIEIRSNQDKYYWSIGPSQLLMTWCENLSSQIEVNLKVFSKIDAIPHIQYTYSIHYHLYYIFLGSIIFILPGLIYSVSRPKLLLVIINMHLHV